MKKSNLKREVKKFLDVRKIVEHGKFNQCWHIILENEEQFVLQNTIKGWISTVGSDKRLMGLHKILEKTKASLILNEVSDEC
jgi:hypothetical protein